MGLYFAAWRPDRVTSLVTVAAHIYVEPSMAPRMISLRTQCESDPELRRKLSRAHGEKFERVFRNWFDGWVDPRHLSWDMRPLLSRIACPCLVVQGQDDEHATPQHARDLASAIPGARLWLIPRVRHMAPQEAPEEFNRRVIEFLAHVGVGSGSAVGDA
jgi:pimeloyl-ACP methyl ester carboxylesterase